MKHGTVSTSTMGIGLRVAAAGLSLLLGAGQQARAEPGPASAPAPQEARATETTRGSDIEQARAHHARGERLFALRRFREAMAAYEAAYELSFLPELLFNIGQCQRNLGNYQSAVFSFQQFLKHKPEAPNREAVRALIQELETTMAADDARTRGDLVGTDPGAPLPREPTRWWLWSGAAAVAVTATLTVMWLAADDDIPGSDLGNLDFEYDRKQSSSRRNRGVFLGLGHELRW